MKRTMVIAVLAVALGAPASAQADLPVVPGQGLQAFILGGVNYTPGSYYETEQVVVVNSDPTPNTTYPVWVSPTPTWCGRGGCNLNTIPFLTTTADEGCGDPGIPATLGPWDGHVDSTDSCMITYRFDMTGAIPSISYDLMAIIDNLSTSAWGHANATTLGVSIPMPPVSIVTGDGAIDFGTGDTTATGNYDSTFAPATVTVTKKTSTGAIKIVRHLEVSNYGKHPWTWNGRKDSGRRVRPGTFHLTVMVGGVKHTRKIIVRK